MNIPRKFILLTAFCTLQISPIAFASESKLTQEAMSLMTKEMSLKQVALFEQTLLHDMSRTESKLAVVEAKLETCASPLEPYMPHLSWLVASYGEPDYSKDNVLRAMELVIESGCNIDEHQHAGLSPLHDAIVLKQFELVEFLIANGADTDNAVNRPGMGSDQASAIQLAELLWERSGDESYKQMVSLLTK